MSKKVTQWQITEIFQYLKQREEDDVKGIIPTFHPYALDVLNDVLKRRRPEDLLLIATDNGVELSIADVRRLIDWCTTRYIYKNRKRIKQTYCDFMNGLGSEASDFADFLVALEVLTLDWFPYDWVFQQELLFKEAGKNSFNRSEKVFQDQWWLSQKGHDFMDLALKIYRSYVKCYLMNQKTVAQNNEN